MSEDGLMMVMILGGFALCGAYFRAQYRDWRAVKPLKLNRKTAPVLPIRVDGRAGDFPAPWWMGARFKSISSWLREV